MDNLIHVLNGYYSSARHISQGAVTWYSFFVTINLVAAGFAIKSLTENGNLDPISRKGLMVIIASTFAASCILAWLGMRKGKNALEKQSVEIQKLIEAIKAKEEAKDIRDINLNSEPIDLYKQIITYFQITAILMIGAWIVGTLLLLLKYKP